MDALSLRDLDIVSFGANALGYLDTLQKSFKFPPRHFRVTIINQFKTDKIEHDTYIKKVIKLNRVKDIPKGRHTRNRNCRS